MTRTTRFAALALATLVAASCGGEQQTGSQEMQQMEEDAGEASTTAEAERSVEIVSPADGDTVSGPQVTVELAAHSFQVVPAGDTTANSGHHHLYLDRDVQVTDQPIPAEEGHIVHMGDGSTSFTFENVEPGQHRLIAVVGDARHVPVSGLQDTVSFTVQ